MQVCIYTGGSSLVGKSGVGQAIIHQKKALEKNGVTVCSRLHTESEIVHINTVLPDSLWAVWAARRAGKKIIYYAHSTMEDFKKSFKGSDLLAPLFKRWIIFCYQKGDVIITPTDYSKKLLESYGIQQPIYALSNGVDTDLFATATEKDNSFWEKFGIEKGKKVVISVGHLIERKGIMEYIELAKTMENVEFLWLGDTGSPLIPKKIAKAIHSAPKNLHFLGYVEQNMLCEIYAQADAFVFLSKEETEGIVVLEALSSGTPTILWDIPAYREWLQDGKNVYKVKTMSEAKKKLEKLLQGSLPDLTEEGRQVAKARNLSAIGKELIKIYQGYHLSSTK